MKDFYTAFYTAIEHSRAHARFCERVFGMDLGQHGFADRSQLELLLQALDLHPAQRVLDLGCGSGLISEYMSDCTEAHITGLDYIPEAVEQARRRTAAKADRLAFVVGDINRLELPHAGYEAVVSIDSIYFSQDYTATVAALKSALQPGGSMAFLYSHGREPWVPVSGFPRETLAPDQTPLAAALQANGLAFRTWDLTGTDYELARRRKAVLAELQAEFEAEGNTFIYDNRLGDANGICQAVEEGLHARYLYHARTRI
jgi:cyclopropane fatty-acyl-phospholipid synthase-like methyltransferase